MEEFLLRENISHYRERLRDPMLAEPARQTISGLLARSEQKLTSLLQTKKSSSRQRQATARHEDAMGRTKL
jgi:hypothetical protein